MIAAIYCPGPSLLRSPVGGFGLTIGVNRAPLILRRSRGQVLDCWAFLDAAVFEQHQPGYRPVLITTHDAVDSISRHGHARELGLHRVKLAGMYEAKARGWRTYTATTAAVIAVLLGSRTIHVFGSDMTDAPDCDGDAPAGCRRNADRWENERSVWRHVNRWASDQGVAIHGVA
jgi:hypothetical protein